MFIDPLAGVEGVCGSAGEGILTFSCALIKLLGADFLKELATRS